MKRPCWEAHPKSSWPKAQSMVSCFTPAHSCQTFFFFFFNLWKYLWAPGLGRKRFFNHQSFSFPAPSSQCRKSAKSHSAFPPSVWSSVPCPFLPLARSLSHIPFNSPCPVYYQTADSGVTTMTGDKTTEQACLHTWGPALSNAKDKEAWDPQFLETVFSWDFLLCLKL